MKNVKSIAMICHEAARAYDLAHGKSVKSWKNTTPEEKAEMITEVQKIINTGAIALTEDMPRERLIYVITVSLFDSKEEISEPAPDQEPANTEKPEQKKFKFQAIIDGTVQHPIFPGKDKISAEKNFRKKYKFATIHTCIEV